MTAMLAFALVSGSGLELSFVGSGISAKMGYMPIRAAMTAEPNGIASAPDLESPKYGSFVVAGHTFAFALDDLEGAAAKLYVDSNGDGRIREALDQVEWAPRTQNGQQMYFGTTKIKISKDMVGTVNFYRFDKNDPSRVELKETILYYTDFGYSGKATFGDKSYNVCVSGMPTGKSTIFIDRTGNGRNDGPSETLIVGKPFTIGGETCVITWDGKSFGMESSDANVAEIPLPPDLAVGKKVPEFNATLMSGKQMNFPSSYKGKIVLLDFWATWCGPCIEELPNVVANYEKYHGQGLEILSVSFDHPEKAEDVSKFAKDHKMNWDHIYEGKYWDTTIGKQYNVRGIPMMLLVDGDTGEILASSPRGAALGKAIEAALARKQG